jgi:hypothetical protein
MGSKEVQQEFSLAIKSPIASKSPSDIVQSSSSGGVIGSCMVQRLSREKGLLGTYQGVRHLVPGNLSKLREVMRRGSGRKQIDSLRAAVGISGR